MKTMKVKTKEDALLHCFDLWLWLAVTGSPYKEKWSGWKENSGYLEKCDSDCPCCEYHKIKRGRCNENCILNWCGGYGCKEFGDEFSTWTDATSSKNRSKWALEIAILALEALTGEED